MKTIVKITPKDSTLHYWNNEGINQELFTELTDTLMPAKGEGKTIHSELIRCANRLSYDYCNNGNCNVVEYEEEVWDEYEEEYVSGDKCISEYYNCMFDFVERMFCEAVSTIGTEFKEAVKTIRDIKDFVLYSDSDSSTYFSNENMAMYDRMIDYVLLYISKTEDSAMDFEM